VEDEETDGDVFGFNEIDLWKMDANLRGLSVFSSNVFRRTTSGKVSLGPTEKWSELLLVNVHFSSFLGFALIE
jgi:hypothetical protein